MKSCRRCRGWRQRASSCRDLHGERGECRALVATASQDGQRRAALLQRCSQTLARRRRGRSLSASNPNRKKSHEGGAERAITVKALHNAGKAIEIDPKDAQAYVNRGVAYGAKGEYD